MGTNTNTKEIEELISLKPCKEGLAFAKSFPSLAEAWEVCENSSWMWWYLQKSEKATKELSVEYAQKCAKHVEHFNVEHLILVLLVQLLMLLTLLLLLILLLVLLFMLLVLPIMLLVLLLPLLLPLLLRLFLLPLLMLLFMPLVLMLLLLLLPLLLRLLLRLLLLMSTNGKLICFVP